MALLTATQLREHLDTDLGDTALGRLAEDADDEITRRYGAHTGNVSETYRPPPGSCLLHLNRQVSAIVSITETYPGVAGETSDVLVAADYAVEGKRTLRRKTGGSFSAIQWAPLTVVVYTPTDDSDRRKRVLIDLVRLALRYNAAQSDRVGDVTITYADYARERELLLRVLAPSIMGVFA
jgi:hypothetical protein